MENQIKDNKSKIDALKKMNPEILKSSGVARVMMNMGDFREDYREFMLNPGAIDSDAELARVPEADYTLLCAIMTMLLKEATFCGEKFFTKRVKNGSVDEITQRMISLLEAEA